jgi:hypothetical protein
MSAPSGTVHLVHANAQRSDLDHPAAVEAHVPCDRLPDGTWLFAPLGQVLVVAGGERIVCHACGEALTAITRHHVRRHELDLPGYRERFGLNRKQSLIAPTLAETRRQEGLRRWEDNPGVRDGLAVGQAMAKSGELHSIGAAAQPAGSRRRQGRRAASGDHAAPALSAARAVQAAAARRRWNERARELGYVDLDAYLADRRSTDATPWQVRRELGCGSPMASRLVEEGR